MDSIQPQRIIEAVHEYLDRGMRVIPVPFRDKRPAIQGWQNIVITNDTVSDYFNGRPSNIGILTGGRSNNLVDIDLDCPEARALAPLFLPTTSMKSGRQSSPNSHWWYRCPNLESQSYSNPERRSGCSSMIVEIRANGRQTIVPPSVHPSGEQIEWLGDSTIEPVQVRADELRTAVEKLAAASLIAARWHEGSRDELTLCISGFFASGGMPQEEAERLVRAICQACGDEEIDSRLSVVRRTYQRLHNGDSITGFARLNELLSVRVVSSLRRWLNLRNYSALRCDVIDSTMFALTDLGNARRLVHHCGADIRYVAPMGRWLVWDGRRWAADKDGAVMRLAKSVVTRIPEEARSARSDEIQGILRHAKSSESISRLTAMIDLAESEPSMTLETDQLDQAHHLLNCANGVLDLRTGSLIHHERENYITSFINIRYDRSASCPQFMAFLRRIMNGNHELMSFLRRAIGYSLTGETSDQVTFFCYGTGANGKSTFINIILHILGKDYAAQANTDLFLSKNNPEHPTAIARLIGKRLVIATEATRGKKLNETLIKQVTGCDVLSARFMRQDFFEYVPQFKLWLIANNKPIIEGMDEAIWRRIRLIPFTVTIPEGERDRDLTNSLKREVEGILAWAVQGASEWYRNGLNPPPEVIAATRNYQREMDLIGQYINERCTVSPERVILFAALHSNLVSWCDQIGEEIPSKKALGQRLGELGFQSDYDNRRNRIWRGLELRPSGISGA